MEDQPRLIAIVFFTPDLGKIQKFYSAVGIKWLGGEEEIGMSGLPLSVERCPKPYGGPGMEGAGLPDLQGDFGEIEFHFYLLKHSTPLPNIPNTRLRIEVENPGKVIEKLKQVGLYKPYLDGIWGSDSLVIDPDGRNIELAPPYSFA